MKEKELLIYADKEFNNGHYKKSQSLYENILAEKPDDVHALIYRELCIIHQSNIKECRIYEFPAIYKETLLSHWDIYGDTKEFFDFALDGLNKAIEVAIEIILRCNEYALQVSKLGPVAMVKGVTDVQRCKFFTGKTLADSVSALLDIAKSFNNSGDKIFIRAIDALEYGAGFENECKEYIAEKGVKSDYENLRKRIEQLKN